MLKRNHENVFALLKLSQTQHMNQEDAEFESSKKIIFVAWNSNILTLSFPASLECVIELNILKAFWISSFQLNEKRKDVA